MKENLYNLRFLGLIIYLCRRWLEVLYWPGLIIIGLTSIALLYYWRTNSKWNNAMNIVCVIACLLLAFGV